MMSIEKGGGENKMVKGVYVPLIALAIMIVIVVCVVLFKGIGFLKNFIELIITTVIAILLSSVILLAGFPDLFINMIEPWRGIVLAFVNTAFGAPIALVLYYPIKLLLGRLRWTKVLGGSS